MMLVSKSSAFKNWLKQNSLLVLKQWTNFKKKNISKFQYIKSFKSGLSREVKLYKVYLENDSIMYIVLAFGFNNRLLLKNEKILRKLPLKAKTLIVETYFIVNTKSNGAYVQVMQFVKGKTFSELIEKNTAQNSYQFINALLKSLTVLHSSFDYSKEYNFAYPNPRGVSYWSKYHRPRLNKSIRLLNHFLPKYIEIIFDFGFIINLGLNQSYKIQPLKHIIKVLNRHSHLSSPNDLSLIHGDCKPENIILCNRILKFIDPHLSYGDPLVDYSKIYYWILTDNTLSIPFIQGNIQTSWEEVWKLNWNKNLLASVYDVNFNPSKKTNELVNYFLKKISMNSWNSIECARFHLCLGGHLIWQSSRLLESGSVQLQNSKYTKRKAFNSEKSFKIIENLSQANPNSFKKETNHIVFSLFMGAYHLWISSQIFINPHEYSINKGFPFTKF